MYSPLLCTPLFLTPLQNPVNATGWASVDLNPITNEKLLKCSLKTTSLLSSEYYSFNSSVYNDLIWGLVNFGFLVYYHWGCTSIYRPLSNPFGSLLWIIFDILNKHVSRLDHKLERFIWIRLKAHVNIIKSKAFL